MKPLPRNQSLFVLPGLSLQNRIVVPPMASGTADKDGYVTQGTIEHYSRLAQSGAGLIFVEYTFIDDSGRSEANQLGIQSDAHILGLSKIASVIHEKGAAAGIQITHAGGKTERSLTGGRLMSPSAIAVPVKERSLEIPDPMSGHDIEMWKKLFIASSTRVREAGFDIVELHAAHGYGLNQWLSPLTNQRSDRYGGSAENRFRLLLEIIEGIRIQEPSLSIAVRMPGQDFVEGGMTGDESRLLAVELEHRGVNLIDVSSGIGGWRRPKERLGEGYLVSEAAAIQAAVSIPVIGVGGIQTGEYIDYAIKEQLLSLAAVGRAILADPEGWKMKNLVDKLEAIKKGASESPL